MKGDRPGVLIAAPVGVLFGLGLMAWAGFRPDSVGPLEWLFSVLHVLIGSLLLAQVLVVAALSLRARRGLIRLGTSVSVEGAL